MTLRIAYVGNFGRGPDDHGTDRSFRSTENDIRESLELLGHEVTPLQENGVTLPHLHAMAAESDLLLWTGTWARMFSHSEMLRMVDSLDGAGIPTAAVHLDVFRDLSRGGRQWWTESMFEMAHVFTADGNEHDDWERHGINHFWLPPGVRDSACFFGTPRPEYRCDVAFVGSAGGPGEYHPEWGYRAELLGELRAMCARRGWSFLNPGGMASEPNWGKVDRGDDLNDFYASAKVTVGDSLCLIREASRYWSDRVYEATGRGGLLIMPQIDALDAEDQFGGVLPMYEWGNWPMLEMMIDGYLDDAMLRASVRSTCQAITAQDHTYSQRMMTLLDVVGLGS